MVLLLISVSLLMIGSMINPMVDSDVTVVAEDDSVVISEGERLPEVAMEAMTLTQHEDGPVVVPL